MRLLSVLLMAFVFNLHATTFKQVATEVQIQEADGIIIGHYLKSKSVLLEDGTIATQMYFKMEKETGFRSDFFGMDEVIVHYPGGTINGEITKVDGVPEFVSGEKVALYTKNIENRYWGLNLAFGTYRIIDYGKNVMLVNSVFPNDSQIGQIKIEEFERLIKKIKGSNLKVVQSAQYLQDPTAYGSRQPASVTEGKNRTIASKNEGLDNSKDPIGISAYWLLGLLAFCGGLFRMSRQRKA